MLKMVEKFKVYLLYSKLMLFSPQEDQDVGQFLLRGGVGNCQALVIVRKREVKNE